MAFATALAERLATLAARPEAADLAIDQWRLVVDTGTSTEIGLKDNETGGPYDSPNQVTGTRGDVFLHWADGRVSSGTVDRTTLENLGEDLRLWRQGAFTDPHAPDVLGPQDITRIPLYDSQVAALVHDDQAPLFALLERIRGELPAFGAERVSGSVTVSTSRRRLLTSRGLDHLSEGTSFGTYADADRRAHDYVSLRGLPTEADITRMIATVGETNRLLKNDAQTVAGMQDVLFTPSTAEAMINKFVIANLDGQRVLNGGSAFALEQFTAGAELFHPTFGLGVDPTRPFSPGSYELTREGLPARREAYIREGRLVTPLLDLKHAKKAGMAATPFPRGGSSLVLDGPRQSFEALVAGIERGLVVYDLLGLHTQDSVRGNFSLTVAHGLVVENGRLIGHAKSMIAGNFLAALREGFRLGEVPGKQVPGLLIRAQVSPG